MTGKYLNTKDAAEYLGVSLSLLEKLRATGEGPSYIRIGRAVRYSISALDAFMTSKENGGW